MMSFICCNVGGGSRAFYLCGIKDLPLTNDCFFPSSACSIFIAWNCSFNLRCSFLSEPRLCCLTSSISSGASLFLCVPAIMESLCFSAFFVLFFEVYTHRYTSWSCIQPSLCVLLVKRQKITSPKNFHLLAKGTVSWRAVHRREAPCLLALLLELWFN